MDNLQEVFLLCWKHGLTIGLPKCEFAVFKIEFLGHLLSPKGCSSLDKHSSALSAFPPQSDKPALQRFLGMLNFYKSLRPLDVGLWDRSSLSTYQHLWTSSLHSRIFFWQWLTGQWLLNPVFELFSWHGSQGLVFWQFSPLTEELSLPPLSGLESVFLLVYWPLQQPRFILKVKGWSCASIAPSRLLCIHMKMVQNGSFTCHWFC